MLSEVCAYLRNYFYHGEPTIGKIEIVNGALKEPYGLKANQYFRIVGSMFNDGVYHRIVGSMFNDGVYQYPLTTLQDETFNGAVWGMAVPPDLIDLITEMEAWKADKANAYALNSPYQSESKADYSYTLKSGADGSGKNSGASALINQFAGRLSRWRKL